MVIICVWIAPICVGKYRLTHLLANLGWVKYDFGCSILCLVLPGLMGNWQNWLSSWARWWNIIVNPTEVRQEMCHPVDTINLQTQNSPDLTTKLGSLVVIINRKFAGTLRCSPTRRIAPRRDCTTEAPSLLQTPTWSAFAARTETTWRTSASSSSSRTSTS